jgi:hypothetical protein
VTTGPQDPAAAGRDRAGQADREQVIGTLKTAFVHGQLTKDELDTRAGQALTADIPPGPPADRLARPPAPARRRPLARAAAGSGGCLIIAAAAIWAHSLLDPGARPTPYGWAAKLLFLAFLAAAVAALAILAYGVAASLEQRRSRRQLPPGPGPGGHTLDGERRGGTGHDPAPPGPRADQTRADLRAHKSRQRRWHIPARPAGHPVA